MNGFTLYDDPRDFEVHFALFDGASLGCPAHCGVGFHLLSFFFYHFYQVSRNKF